MYFYSIYYTIIPNSLFHKIFFLNIGIQTKISTQSKTFQQHIIYIVYRSSHFYRLSLTTLHKQVLNLYIRYRIIIGLKFQFTTIPEAILDNHKYTLLPRILKCSKIESCQTPCISFLSAIGAKQNRTELFILSDFVLYLGLYPYRHFTHIFMHTAILFRHF